MYSAKSLGNNTMSCNDGSICSPPEWPCRVFANNSATFALTNADKTRIVMQTSVPEFGIQLLRLLFVVQKDHVEAIWSSSSKHQKSFGRTLLVRRRSICACGVVSQLLGEDDLGNDVRSCFCGRLVLGQGAKVLSGSAQGICPPHRGS